MSRQFIGIMLPALLQPELLSLLPEHRQLKPARPGQLHLTLQFLGELPEELSSTLQRALAELRCSRFRMSLAGTGFFEHDSGYRGVLWAGVQPCELLQHLYSAVTAVVGSLGLPLETRPWAPHITLARYSGGPLEEMERFLKRGRRFAAEVDVDNFQLVQSQPGPAGSVYTPLSIFPLV